MGHQGIKELGVGAAYEGQQASGMGHLGISISQLYKLFIPLSLKSY
jgi:hypothetical protein